MILLRISAMKGTKTMADYFFENIEAFDSPEAVLGGSKNDKTDLTLCGHNVIYNMYGISLARYQNPAWTSLRKRYKQLYV